MPDLATEVPTAANGGITQGGRVYTFHIKKGMEFAPPVSRDVTAQDFKYSIERMLKSPLAPATYFYTGITGAQAFMNGKAKDVQGIKVVDPNTLQITLDKPDVSFLYTMTLTFTSAMAKEWVDQVGKQINRKPLGTGPYVITKWVPGQEIVCKPNPNWHLNKQQWLDEIDFNFSSNPSTALLKVERGEVDLMGDPVSPADYQRTKIDPTWSKYMAEAPQIDSFYAFLNVQVKPFDNPLVRQAVNYAVDKVKLQKLLSGQAVAANQVYPQGMPGYETGKTFYSYDPAKAKQLLAQAGFPNGFSTTLYTHNVDPFPKVAQALQADLKAVGINACIKQMDRATYWDKIELQSSKFAHGAHATGTWTTRTPATGSGRSTAAPPPWTAAPTWAGGRTRRSTACTRRRPACWTRRSAPTCTSRCRTSSCPRRPRCRCTSRSTPACAARTRAASSSSRCGSTSSRTTGRRTASESRRGAALMQTRRAASGQERARSARRRPLAARGRPGSGRRHG